MCKLPWMQNNHLYNVYPNIDVTKGKMKIILTTILPTGLATRQKLCPIFKFRICKIIEYDKNTVPRSIY